MTGSVRLENSDSRMLSAAEHAPVMPMDSTEAMMLIGKEMNEKIKPKQELKVEPPIIEAIIARRPLTMLITTLSSAPSNPPKLR